MAATTAFNPNSAFNDWRSANQIPSAGQSVQAYADVASSPSPLCKCGEAKRLCTVKKDGPNQGLEFYACPKPQGQDCQGTFQWKDPAKAAVAKKGAAAADQARLQLLEQRLDAVERNISLLRSMLASQGSSSSAMEQ
jgi:hypothetical protein